MAQSLYNRYRPRTFAEVLGQDHVIRTLRNAVKSGRVGHAYLFCGTRGVGKTTTARLLAKAVNCERRRPGDSEPCGGQADACSMCRAIAAGHALDVIEIDGASNRGIDDVRQIREKIAFAPNQARYKFYIIDEVHRLTGDAFNALLKTLEEPPAHAKFVFATTEPLRLPATILSRCQRFDLRQLSVAELVENLRRVCDQEGFAYEEPALEFLARAGAGSSRDALSLLEQANIFCESNLTLSGVREMLGHAGSAAVEELTGHIIDRDAAAALSQLHRMALQGTDLRELSRQILEHWRALMLTKIGGAAAAGLDLPASAVEVVKEQGARIDLPRIVRTLGQLHRAVTEIGDAVQPQLPLELAVVAAVHQTEPREAAGESQGRRAPTAASPPRPTPAAASGRGAAEDRPKTQTPLDGAFPSSPPAGHDGPVTVEEARQAWPALLKRLRSQKRWMLEALLRSTQLGEVQDGELQLLTQAPLLREQIDKERAIVEEELRAVLGRPLRLACVLKSARGQSPGAGSPTPQRAEPVADATSPPAQFEAQSAPSATASALRTPPPTSLPPSPAVEEPLEDEDDLVRAAREMFGSRQVPPSPPKEDSGA